MTLAGPDHFLAASVFWFATVETTAFLGACVGLVVLLVVVALYLSRKWYSTPTGATTTSLFGAVCVPVCESSNSSAAHQSL
ncbi:hypothetical protein TSAR_001958, partial [Trichomalopsis sarcophagae]